MAGNKNKKVIQLIEGLKVCWPDFDMTPKEFLNPTINSIIIFFERFIHAFGIKTDTIITRLNQILLQQDEYEDIIYVYILYTCASYICEQLDLTSLGSLALTFLNCISPEDDKNLVNRISIIANYLYYVKETELTIILPLKTKVLEELDSLVDLNKEVNNLNEDLKSLAYKQAIFLDKRQRLDNNKEILKNNLLEPQLNTEKQAEKIQILKNELKLLEEENAELTENIDKNMTRGNQLRDLIIDDHETVLAERNKLEKELADEQPEFNDFRKTLVSKVENDPHLLKNYEVENNLIDIVKLPNILDAYNLREEHRNEKEKIIKEIKAVYKIDNEILNKLQELNKENSELEAKMQIVDKKWTDCDAVFDNKRKHMANEYENVKLQYHRSSEDVAEVNKCFELCTGFCDEWKQTIEQDNVYYEKLYKDFLNARTSLDNKFLTTLDLIKKEVSK